VRGRGDSPLLLDNHFVVVTNCFAVEKAVILEMFYPESYFLKYEILNQVQDDGLGVSTPAEWGK